MAKGGRTPAHRKGDDLSPAVALARRIEKTLPLSSPAETRRAVDLWLSEIAKTAAGKALKRIFAQAPKARALLDAVAEYSPYLWELARGNPARLVTVLEGDPDERLDSLLAETMRAVAGAEEEADAMRLLRLAKAEAALLIALADIGGVWPVMRVTSAMSELADTAVQAAARFALRNAARQGKLQLDAQRPEDGCGLIVLAMGKMGAHELNYSSDIDLIVFYDPTAPAIRADVEPAGLYIRLTRGIVKLLQERTPDGYVFRVDLRLRPDPASTQIAISTPAGLSYYESTGQNWERAALIKARPCAGDLAAGETFLRDVSPFIWRKYLDFVAVADVHVMKRQIHAYKGHGDIAVEGHNVKLGRGGIREIEFFVQTQQLIAGGRHPELRGRSTLEMLAKLAAGGWIDGAVEHDLREAYLFLRNVEHRLQMVGDEQTHTLPGDSEELARFSRFLGFADRDAFATALVGHLAKVQRHYARLFEHAPAREAERRGLAFPPDADVRETLDKLAAMGFRRPPEVSGGVRRWLSGAYRSLRGETARGELTELVPVLLAEFARSENPDGAVVAFDRFLMGLTASARLLSLLRQNPDLVALLSLVLGTAPRLADILARHPQAMDALIDPIFSGALAGEGKLTAELRNSLRQSVSYEDVLDRLRLFGQEHMFLIGTRILSGSLSAAQAGEAFARLADVLLQMLHHVTEDEFAVVHGRVPGQESAIVAVGKLGGREMTAGSDLDLIIVYHFNPARPESSGARPLHATQYFARMTQRLVGALSRPTNYGTLYNVDMRLRPSGRSGPLATSIESFAGYQQNEAWTWEHMVLTRARVVSGAPAFAARVEAVIRDVLCRPRDVASTAADVAEMRAAIAHEKREDLRWDLKYAAGGLIDLEFIAQFLQLVHAHERPEILDTSTARVLEKAAKFGLVSSADAEVLRKAARLYHDLTQILRLCLSAPFDPATSGAGLLALLARAADVPDFATLEADLADTQRKVRACFTRMLGRVGS
jgi:[glutamine synthetase] adenylyltransferase / [glutamine synthetase]-adenylyl-L-tyrosine phosphorylase